MWDLSTFIADCRTAARDADPRGAVRELLCRTMEQRADVQSALAMYGGLSVLYNDADLTVLNIVWAPRFSIFPHDHRMWAAIGIYAGVEDNVLYRRGAERLQQAGQRTLDTGEVFGLGADAIHAVHNPCDKPTGAIHVYGGDFVHQPRSQWDPDTLLEQPYDMAEVQRRFAEANAQWRAQLGYDLDEAVT